MQILVTIGSGVSEFPTFLLTCVVVLKTLWHYRASVWLTVLRAMTRQYPISLAFTLFRTLSQCSWDQMTVLSLPNAAIAFSNICTSAAVCFISSLYTKCWLLLPPTVCLSNFIAAHYKIVPIKIAHKLAIKICDKNWHVWILFCSLYEHQLVKCSVHKTRKIKFIYANFYHIFIMTEPASDSWPWLLTCRVISCFWTKNRVKFLVKSK